MINKLTFVTSNKGKVSELQKLLDIPVQQVTIDLPEIQSLELEEIIEHKAREAYKAVKAPIIVEDTSLTFKALRKLPGPLIKWFLKELNTEGMCEMMKQYEEKDAVAKNMIGLFDGEKILFFSGEMEGEISSEPRGSNGFGWDPIFIPKNSTKTMAEMSSEEKLLISFRAKAVTSLKEYLLSNSPSANHKAT